jgi:hypothetical protein
MDVLVLQVIPQFRNRLLGTFHANVGRENKIPLDPDIRAFYERFQKLHAPTLASLTEVLRKLKTKCTNFHRKIRRIRRETGIWCYARLKKQRLTNLSADVARMNW